MKAADTRIAPGSADRAVAGLAARFWGWRAAQQPHSRDDIPRLERPAEWVPDWSPEAVEAYRERLAAFRRELRYLDTSGAPVPVQVDRRLVSSAVARVGWELEDLRLWQRHPGFYVDQAIGPVYDLLLRPPPFEEERVSAIERHLRRVPRVLEWAAENTRGHAVAEFAAAASAELVAVESRLARAIEALSRVLPDGAPDLSAAAASAGRALGGFRARLRRRLPGLPPHRPVGERALQRYLSTVALLPWTVAELGELGRHEDARAAAAGLMVGDGAAPPPLPRDAADQCARQAADEARVRAFQIERGLLDPPPGRYRFTPLPDYLAPLRWLGVPDDLTGPSRLGRDAVRYVQPPGPDLTYFDRADALDPRLGIVHEGAHFQQLALSWRHPDPVRRHYYDSTPNEGIAFYNEELMLLAGLFDDSAYARRTVHNFMRLRTLRVVVDIALAVGDMSIPQAAELLARTVPMDGATAAQEASFFAATPAQALSYQAGKTQVLKLLADARAAHGDSFDLRSFHLHLWTNGNVPLSLLRWEQLDDRSELSRAEDNYPG